MIGGRFRMGCLPVQSSHFLRTHSRFMKYPQGLVLSLFFLFSGTGHAQHGEAVPENPTDIRHYFQKFNETDPEIYVQDIPNSEALSYLHEVIPRVDLPDTVLEEIYYFRWWTYRKHIKSTPAGTVITEFLPEVEWAGPYNTISAPLGHQIMEGRWLHNSRFLEEYIRFWYEGNTREHLYSYSNWLGYAVWQKYLVDGDAAFLVQQLPGMIASFTRWENTHHTRDGLYWSYDVRDGMEESISGSRTQKNIRATIMSYQYGLAYAISMTAALAGKNSISSMYQDKAERIKSALDASLWDENANFYKVRLEDGGLSSALELHGYVPWYFKIPDAGRNRAWEKLMDENIFFAPYGPTTADQRHPDFSVEKSYVSSKACRWDGPSWPFATSQTLTALANFLNQYDQTPISKADYLRLLKTYAGSHYRVTSQGKKIPWIDESLNPYTGEWITRRRFEEENFNGWGAGGSRNKPERGKDYNHSTFADLIITGLLGVRPAPDHLLINPLIPQHTWDWFYLENVKIRGKILKVVWDRQGTHYGQGKGFRVLYDGRTLHHSEQIETVRIDL